jgi:hypothetical protein
MDDDRLSPRLVQTAYSHRVGLIRVIAQTPSATHKGTRMSSASAPIPPDAKPTAMDGTAAAEVQASIDAYLGSADQMHTVAGVVMWVCVAAIVLLVIGWAAGMLPGAVRLF